MLMKDGSKKLESWIYWIFRSESTKKYIRVIAM